MAVNSENINDAYAVIRTSGRQYKVSAGQKIKVNKVEANPGEQVTIDQVLLLSSGNQTDRKLLVGSPLVAGASVTLKVLRHSKDKKVRIFKKKRRTGYTKRQGHRQQVTELQVQSIQVPA